MKKTQDVRPLNNSEITEALKIEILEDAAREIKFKLLAIAIGFILGLGITFFIWKVREGSIFLYSRFLNRSNLSISEVQYKEITGRLDKLETSMSTSSPSTALTARMNSLESSVNNLGELIDTDPASIIAVRILKENQDNIKERSLRLEESILNAHNRIDTIWTGVLITGGMSIFSLLVANIYQNVTKKGKK